MVGAMLHDRPSRLQLKDFRQEHTGINADGLFRTERTHTVVPSYKAPPADLMVDWVDATKDVKDLKKCQNTTDGYAKLFGRRCGVTAEHLKDSLESVSKEQLRKARVRVDVVGMWVWRFFFQTMLLGSIENINFYLYTDASPQRGGTEMYATSFELFWNGEWWRRMLPHTEPLNMTAAGKLATMLYQIFLMFGPDLAVVDIMTRRIRSICSDMGTERLTTLAHGIEFC